jgi:hypothetical protein
MDFPRGASGLAAGGASPPRSPAPGAAAGPPAAGGGMSCPVTFPALAVPTPPSSQPERAERPRKLAAITPVATRPVASKFCVIFKPRLEFFMSLKSPGRHRPGKGCQKSPAMKKPSSREVNPALELMQGTVAEFTKSSSGKKNTKRCAALATQAIQVWLAKKRIQSVEVWHTLAAGVNCR